MNTNKKTPKLRFKGFTDDWEQRKLNDFGIATGGTSIESEFVDGGTYKVINIGSYSEESVYNDQGLRVNKTDKTKSRILNKYDLTMILNDKTASGNIIGRVLLIDQDNTYVYNQRTERIDVDTKNFLPMFLYHMLNAPEQRKYIVKASQGNTQIYVNWSTISNIDYMIPQLLLEQEKIANLFSLINKDITLHQRKLEKLKLNKSALLQKLFPQKGCTIPDVRFKGFTDAWEQRKLNDFGIATGGTSIESEFVDGGTYKVINIGSYSEESVYNDQGLRVNKTDKTKSRILNKYDLTMILNDKTASGNIIGRVLLIDQDNTYVYNQRTERIDVDTKNFLPMFLYHMLNAPEQRKYIVKASQGNTQIYVNWSTISNIDYMIPQLLLEQEKIANLFSLINKDITLHQRKVDRLISIKKGLLQQLFV